MINFQFLDLADFTHINGLGLERTTKIKKKMMYLLHGYSICFNMNTESFEIKKIKNLQQPLICDGNELLPLK